MIPGRKYTPEDIIALGLRFKWLILLPWIVIASGAAFFARTLPDQYRSDSLIQVVAPRVPESLVRSTITEGIDERLPVITQQILSRTRLERIISDFGLYTDDKRTKLMEDIIADMRVDIVVEPVKGDAFRVSFVSSDAKVAMRVTERLATLFVDENLRDRAQLAEGANSFLDSQLDDARRRLLDQEKKVEEYRRQFVGQLPTQLGTNLQTIAGLQNLVAQNAEAINRDHDRRLVLERSITEIEAESATAQQQQQLISANESATAGPQAAAVQLARAKAGLAQMELVMKGDHPDINRQKRLIRELESKAQDEALSAPVSPGMQAAANPAEAARQTRIRDTRFQIEMLDRQIAERERNIKRGQGQLAVIEGRVEATPTRESEMVALTRDYETLQKIYTNTLSKSEDAKMAANLERRQIGEQFKIIDPARVPERPFSPNRLQFYLGGLFGGLAFGVGVVALLEFRDSSLRNESDVVAALALPVLATIPAILTSRDRRVARRRRRWIALASATGVALVAGAAVAWRLRLLERLF
jgi:polysaccharide chain length determinant protein (PEP-CTERM system associated)